MVNRDDKTHHRPEKPCFGGAFYCHYLSCYHVNVISHAIGFIIMATKPKAKPKTAPKTKPKTNAGGGFGKMKPMQKKQKAK